LPHDPQIFFKVQFEDLQGFFHIRHGSGDGHQGQGYVALLDVVFDPLLVDGDVPFQVVEARMAQDLSNFVGVEIHAEDLPVPGSQDTPDQGIADEAVDAEDEDFHGLLWTF